MQFEAARVLAGSHLVLAVQLRKHGVLWRWHQEEQDPLVACVLPGPGMHHMRHRLRRGGLAEVCR
jgi:hypothetical protein